MSETPPPDAATPRGTAWEQLQAMKQEGQSREAMRERLTSLGLDEESAKVLLNAVAGALPSELPSVELSPGRNPLAPQVFAVSDLGLTGAPTTVGLYWIGFGASVLVSLGLGWLFLEAGIGSMPEAATRFAATLGSVMALLAIAWGAFKYASGLRVRRR